VLLSSHLLAEIQQVADTVTILARGRRVASGAVAEVLAGRSAGEVRVRVPDAAMAATILAGAGFSVSPPDVPDGRTLLVHGVAAPGEITRVLAGQGTYVEELTPMTADLETAFLALTGDQA